MTSERDFGRVYEPQVDRRFRLYWYQWLGMPFIMAVPILAMFGVFGLHRTIERVRSPKFVMSVEYPDRIRHDQLDDIRIEVTNISGTTLDTISVALDPAYLRSFANVTITPTPQVEARVDLEKVEPNETRIIDASVYAHGGGRVEGWIHAAAVHGDTIAARLHTFIFP